VDAPLWLLTGPQKHRPFVRKWWQTKKMEPCRPRADFMALAAIRRGGRPVLPYSREISI